MADWKVFNLLFLACIVLLSHYYLKLHFQRIKINKKIQNKNIVITGASSGLGFEVAKILSKRHCNVVMAARSQSKLNSAVKEVKRLSKNQNVFAYPLDVTDGSACEEFFVDLFDKKGFFGSNGSNRIDYLFCCAGKALPGLFLDNSLDDFKYSMNVNYFGALNMAMGALKKMKKQNFGSIVFIGSTLSVLTLPGYSDYSPTKWALRALLRTLQREFVGTGIQMSIYYPPNMATPGFEEEQKRKPAVTRTIEGNVSTYKAKSCAKKMIKGVERGDLEISHDWLTFFLLIARGGTISCGLKEIALMSFLLPFAFFVSKAVDLYSRIIVKSE